MTDFGGIQAEQLRQYIERIERIEEEKQDLQAQEKEVFNEAKANGFDTKIMRQVLKLRKMDHADRQEQETMLEVYKRAVGLAGGSSDDKGS